MAKSNLEYVNPNCILRINLKGKIKVLFYPFREKCIKSVGRFPSHLWLYAD